MSIDKIAMDLEKINVLYVEQIRSFDAQALPDLKTQIEERKKAFDTLKQHVGDVLSAMKDHGIVENHNAMEEMIKHLKLLARQNKTLKGRVEAVKEALKTNMAQLNTGRKVIDAYRAPQSIRNRPKVLTIRNY